MNHCYFKAAKLYTDLAEADDNLKEVTEVGLFGGGRGWVAGGDIYIYFLLVKINPFKFAYAHTCLFFF